MAKNIHEGDWEGVTCSLSRALGFTSWKPTKPLTPISQNPKFWPLARNLPVEGWHGMAKSRDSSNKIILQGLFITYSSGIRARQSRKPTGSYWYVLIEKLFLRLAEEWHVKKMSSSRISSWSDSKTNIAVWLWGQWHPPQGTLWCFKADYSAQTQGMQWWV